MLNADRFADKSPAQAWAVLLDEGIYLASVSTMYRVLRAADQVRERRAQAAHPARVRPELTADGPSQVWSWDITKLKGPSRGIWFDLFVMLDIFSRKAIRWEVHATENAELAKAFIDAAVISNGGIAPVSIHADRGTSMTSKPVAVLLADLHISQSHSRPHVSNDNPYSEAQFKTLKYCPAFPGQFGSLARRPRLQRGLLHLLQQRAPPFRHRPAHPRIRARRHRHPDPGPPRTGPPAGLRRQPRPVPPAPHATAPARQRSGSTSPPQPSKRR